MKNTKESMKDEGMSDVKKGALIGAGLVAFSAALAGTYFLYGSKNADKHRKQVKSWALKAKGDILERLETLPEINEEIYHKIVGEVADRYQAMKNIDVEEMKDFRSELQSHWGNIKEGIEMAISGKVNGQEKSKNSAKGKSKVAKAKSKSPKKSK